MALRKERGLYWVESDIDCAAVLFDQVLSIQSDVLPYVEDFSVCVQAGGNCGLFPLELSKFFDEVITAEPDPENFEALLANVENFPNIRPFNLAFGDVYASIAVDSEVGNCGATFVKNQLGAGEIALRTIDGFKLTKCGLIYLDVEGYEEFVLRGAKQTILSNHPTIVLEAKGLARRYGRTDQTCAEMLQAMNYEVVHKFDNDVVWCPCR